MVSLHQQLAPSRSTNLLPAVVPLPTYYCYSQMMANPSIFRCRSTRVRAARAVSASSNTMVQQSAGGALAAGLPEENDDVLYQHYAGSEGVLPQL